MNLLSQPVPRALHAATPSALSRPTTRHTLLSMAVAGVALLGAAPAMADVINFDNYQPDIFSSGSVLQTPAYNLLFLPDPTSGAYGWSSGVGAILDGTAASSCDVIACPGGASGNYLAILNDGGLNFSRPDQVGFKLAGFDYAFMAPVAGLPDYQWGQLRLSGTLLNGKVVTTSLDFPGQNANGDYQFQSASLAGFSNQVLLGLTFSACVYNESSVCVNSLDTPAFNQAQFALDNINISAVPEPSSYLLLLAGLGGIALFSRRRIVAQPAVQGAAA